MHLRSGFGIRTGWWRALLSVALLWGGGALDLVGQDEDLASAIQLRIESGRASGTYAAAGQTARARQALPRFYEERAFHPAWISERPVLSSAFDELRTVLGGASNHGLDPADYHLTQLDSLARLVRSGEGGTRARVDLDLLASDAFMTLGSHLLMGSVNPTTIDPEWLANRRTAEFETVLAKALETGSIRRDLEALAPPQPRYGRLLNAVEQLRAAAASGGWPRVPEGDKLETGVRDPRVAALRRRLRASGDLAADPTDADSDHFDARLAESVARFQGRHGLEPDGVVGPATVAALNVTAAERARQVQVNLERWRWLPNDLGTRHIEVNIAGFDVKVVENGRTVRTHRAVVGRQYRQTPMFSGTMTYLVLAPYWHVPPTIAAVDKLPLIKADLGYLAAQRMTLFDQATNAPVNPTAVQWEDMSGSDFNRRYRLRQDPGPRNALGAVKFMFPNRHNVYLHDTPSRELFGRASRAFSSGCVRTEDPLALAEYLLGDQPGWTRSRIDAVVAGGVEQSVRLSTPLPVHLLYWTAWADEDGAIQFREDLYGRDAKVWAAMTAQPPAS